MVTFTSFLLTYLLGGLTFIPLVIGAILLHAHLTFPDHSKLSATSNGNVQAPGDQDGTKKASFGDDDLSDLPTDLPEELKPRVHEPDVAAGYFAVCREYVPGGVNGKPPERTTPTGSVIAAESPSVYQSMYRSLFDRKKKAGPSIEGGKGGAAQVKRGNNVFYVVLRLGHLMLYDNEEQLEVRHVISLAHHGVDIHGGGGVIREGELFVKRNCIRLTSRRIYGEVTHESRPFYLFSENCSEKEDFYHALLQNQERKPDSPDNPPTPLEFDQAHLIKLVQQLHASEENLQTRWFNAMLGRVFLSLYKTSEVEDFIRTKITKKISRVQKPAFLDSVTVGQIHMGDAAPMITHPKLRELTMDGDVTIEADVKYNGKFRLEIAAIARIDLGSRMKAREVSLLLAGILKKLEGHVLFRIKPPPSNRVWFSFETPPKMELSIEPVVSQRQITYGFILRAIENRIRDVLAETLVYPNWDDVPFYHTFLQRFRGGLWEDDVKPKPHLEPPPPLPGSKTESAEDTVETKHANSDDDASEISIPPMLPERGKVMSTPFLANSPPSALTARNAASRSTASVDVAGVSSGVETPRDGTTPRLSSANVKGGSPPKKPQALRSHSFANPSAASTQLSTDPVIGDSVPSGRSSPSPSPGTAAATMKDINAVQHQRSRGPSRSASLNVSPRESPVGSLERSSEAAEYMAQAAASIGRSKKGSVGSTKSNVSATDSESASMAAATAPEVEEEIVGIMDAPELSARPTSSSSSKRQSTISSHSHARTDSTDFATSDSISSIGGGDTESSPKAAKRSTGATAKMIANAATNKRQSLGTATAAAKRWGLGIMAARQNAKASATSSNAPVDTNEQISKLDAEDEARDSAAAPLDRKASHSSLEGSIHSSDGGPGRSSSPSMIPRRISSQSLSSSASSSNNTAVPVRSPTPSKIPAPSQRSSNNSLRNSFSPTSATSPSLGSSSSLTPTPSSPQLQQSSNIPRPSPDAHGRKASMSSIPHGPGSPMQPIGRGQPLPPPGQPLPGPQRAGTWAGALSASTNVLMNMGMSMKRKPVGSAGNSVDLGRRQSASGEKEILDGEEKDETQEKRPVPPPPLPRRPDPVAERKTDLHDDANGSLEGKQGVKRQSLSIKKRPVPKPPLPPRAEPQTQTAIETRAPSDEPTAEPSTETSESHEKADDEADDDYGAWEENTENVPSAETESDEHHPDGTADGKHEDGSVHHTDEEEAFGPMEMNIEENAHSHPNGGVVEAQEVDKNASLTAAKDAPAKREEDDAGDEDDGAWETWGSNDATEDNNEGDGEQTAEERSVAAHA